MSCFSFSFGKNNFLFCFLKSFLACRLPLKPDPVGKNLAIEDKENDQNFETISFFCICSSVHLFICSSVLLFICSSVFSVHFSHLFITEYLSDYLFMSTQGSLSLSLPLSLFLSLSLSLSRSLSLFVLLCIILRKSIFPCKLADGPTM